MLKKSVLILVCSMTISTFLSIGAANSIPDSNPVPEKICKAVSEYDALDKESLGFLKYGLDSKDVTAKLGQPEKKSKAVVWGADGLSHQTWVYKSKGIELDMVKDKTLTVDRITITAPCKYKTKRNISIGSTRDMVVNAYGKDINSTDSTKTSIVVGSTFGGIMFGIKKDRVSEIFIGAAAE